MVFPPPGGPVTVVSGPRAPSAMSLSTLGRFTTQPGMAGGVILDIRIGSSRPAGPLRGTACRSVAISTALLSFLLALGGGQLRIWEWRAAGLGKASQSPCSLFPLREGEFTPPFAKYHQGEESSAVNGVRRAIPRDARRGHARMPIAWEPPV